MMSMYENRMEATMNFHHVSVLLEECLEGLAIKPQGIYVDGTLGGAGHSKAICKKLEVNGRLIGVDQDINAINAARDNLNVYAENVILTHANFSDIKYILQEQKIEQVDGILLDLGVSSHQLDEGERGFSYMQDGPLDMRMDHRQTRSAKEVVNTYSEQQLADIIRRYGEENWAKRIAQFIIEERKHKTIDTTYELVDIIKKAVPKGARKDGPHPAKRTFQALRIEVNRELEILTKTIEDAISVLKSGGRLCIITFHSLEDRIVKCTYKDLENPCSCPPAFPICVCNKKASVKVITRKPILPSDEEIERNPRARSAKLRVVEKL